MKQNEFLNLIASPLMNLDHTYRYSGTKLVEGESLSQHIVDTIMMGIRIIDELNERSSSPNQFSIERYIMKAVYHDLEEVITGDIPRPLKYHDEETLSSMRNVADEVAKSLFQSQFYNWESHYIEWDTAKEGKEGYILKLVDNLVVVNKVIKEVSLLHNYYMLRVAHEVIQYTSELKDNTHYFDDAIDKGAMDYIESLLDGAITAMRNILEAHDEEFRLSSYSMI